jgi:hypothetical protein
MANHLGQWLVMARKLNKSAQLSYHSSDQLKAELGTLRIRLGLKRGYLGGKLADGHVVNAIVFWLTQLDPEVGDWVASHALDMLEDYVMNRPVRRAEAALPQPRLERSGPLYPAEVEVEILGNVTLPTPNEPHRNDLPPLDVDRPARDRRKP